MNIWIKVSEKRRWVRCGAEIRQKSVVFLVLLAPQMSFAQQEERGIRLQVTSIAFEEVGKVPGEKDKVSEDAKTKNPQTLGIAKIVRVNFRIPDELRQPPHPYRLPTGEGRIGLFLERDRGTHASVQRGTLEKCETGFCSATFKDNALFRFYQAEMQKSNEWFVQSLQNPAIEERLLELGKVEEKGWDYKLSVEAQYGRSGVFLKETSNTPYNFYKRSNKLSHGNSANFLIKFDNIELNYHQWKINLSTQGFFADSFSTTYSGVKYGGRYGVPLANTVLVGGEVFYLSEKFTTGNDDEAILNTDYQSFQAGAYLRYIVPKDVFRFEWKRFALECGEGMISVSSTLFGNAEDFGEWKRGSAGIWRKYSLYAEHYLVTRSSSIWWDQWKLGANAGFSLAAEKFSGTPEGPSTGLTPNTTTSGFYVTWGFLVGRRMTW